MKNNPLVWFFMFALAFSWALGFPAALSPEKYGGLEFLSTFGPALAAFWLENYETISVILERAESLSKTIQETDLEFVLRHADIHYANLLLSDDDKIHIVDWDEILLAPKERDLPFIIGSIFNDTSDGNWEQLFFKGYGETEVDPLALAYYRYDWCVEDIGEFAEDVFSRGNLGKETKANSIRWFKSLFAKGSSIETALNTEIKFEPTHAVEVVKQ
jgi:spectinomycin phosphotransferase